MLSSEKRAMIQSKPTIAPSAIAIWALEGKQRVDDVMPVGAIITQSVETENARAHRKAVLYLK